MGNDLLERVALDIANEFVDMGYRGAYRFAQDGNVDTFERVVDGVRLQVEVQYFFDSGPGGPIRVLVAVDDCGITSLMPRTADVVIGVPSLEDA